MSLEREPLRWMDDPEALPAGMGEELARYREQAPSAAQRARMLERLEAAANAAEPRAAEPGVARGVFAKRAWWWLGGALGVLGMLSLATLGVLDEPVPQVTVPNATAQQVIPPTESARPPEQPAPEPPPAAPALDAPAQPVQRRARHARVDDARVAPARPEAAPLEERADPGAELALLTRARRLASAAPAQALALTEEHATLFPRGVFVEERELIAIEALAQAGRVHEALARAKAFFAAHPRSAHGERVRVIVQGLEQIAPNGL